MKKIDDYLQIKEAADTVIYGTDGSKHQLLSSKRGFEGILNLIHALQPRTDNEAFQAAQFLACHLIGITKLSRKFQEDKKLALKFFQFCNDLMVK